jgi:hypothetical protein
VKGLQDLKILSVPRKLKTFVSIGLVMFFRIIWTENNNVSIQHSRGSCGQTNGLGVTN